MGLWLGELFVQEGAPQLPWLGAGDGSGGHGPLLLLKGLPRVCWPADRLLPYVPRSHFPLLTPALGSLAGLRLLIAPLPEGGLPRLRPRAPAAVAAARPLPPLLFQPAVPLLLLCCGPEAVLADPLTSETTRSPLGPEGLSWKRPLSLWKARSAPEALATCRAMHPGSTSSESWPWC